MSGKEEKKITLDQITPCPGIKILSLPSNNVSCKSSCSIFKSRSGVASCPSLEKQIPVIMYVPFALWHIAWRM